MDGITLLSLVGLLLSFAAMAILIFKKISPVLIGPLAAIMLCLFSGLPVLDSIINSYVPGVGDFFVSYFLIFLLGNMLGNIYQISGAASKLGALIAKAFGAKRILNCMIACLVATAVLTYGGINGFVIIFAMYPIALKLFEEANISTDLLPGIVAGGMWTFALTGPFTPQVPNIVSMENLGTPSYAGMIPGIAGSLTMAVLVVAYMTWQAKKSQRNGVTFQPPTHIKVDDAHKSLPNGAFTFIPLIVVVIGFNVTNINIIVWLAIGNLLSIVLFWPQLSLKELISTMNAASASSIDTIMNTAAIVGFGNVVKLTPFFAFAVGTLNEITANPYVIAAVGSNVFAGILGSATGGVGLMYSSLKDTFLNFGAQGYNLEFIHRLCSFGCGGLDSLPWNGSIVSVFKVCNTDHKRSYKYIFVNCCLIPIFATFCVALPVCILLG